jgi:hypothetical protein
MKDSTSRAGAHSPYVTSLVVVAIALCGTVALGTFAYIAGSVASPPDIRGALFMRSGYEDAGSEVVRQYRIALKRRDNAELCVIAGMSPPSTRKSVTNSQRWPGKARNAETALRRGWKAFGGTCAWRADISPGRLRSSEHGIILWPSAALPFSVPLPLPSRPSWSR